MLGFLEKVRLRRTVAKRLRLSRLDTLPRTYINTVRFQLGRGAVHGALLTAQEGLSRYPASDELSGLHRFAVRRLASPARRALEAEVDARGDDASMARLIRLHIECGDFHEALFLADSMTGGQQNSLSLRLKGEAHIGRFFQDGVADDAREGIKLLEDSIEGGPEEFEAVWLLAQVHERVGVVSRSLFFVYRALSLDASHEDALSLHARLVKCSLEAKTLDEALSSLESESALGGDGPSVQVGNSRALHSHLVRLSLIGGLQRVFFMNGSILLLASRGSAVVELSSEERVFCQRALEFRQTIGRGIRRMGLGTFQRAALEVADRHLSLFAAENGVLVVESNIGARAELIRSECDDLLASWSQQSEKLTLA